MTDGDEWEAAGRAAAGDKQYETKVVQAIRGTESRAEAKWRKEGWELVDQSPGTLRTEMTFRRVKSKTFGAYLAQGYTAFRGLTPRTQKVVAASVGGMLLVLGTGGIVAATLGDDDPSPTAATPTATAAAPSPDAAAPSTDEAATPSQELAAPSTEALEEASGDATDEEAEAEAEQPEPEPYTYAGPDYEIVTVDKGAILGELDQYWVLTDKLDYADPQYEDLVRSVIADVALKAGTDALGVEVVSDEEIVEAESADSIADFMQQHAGTDYYVDVIVPKEASDWIASYRGGALETDDGLRLSDASDAFEIVWLPASDSPDFETWKPETPSS